MTISSDVRQQVRQRAKYCCEYCDVSETDTGAELTLDHFYPTSKGGSDTIDNLVYCCYKCNQYKGSYAQEATLAEIWNPRISSREEHFLVLTSGELYPLSNIANYTLVLLRLNRKPLIALRKKRLEQEHLEQQLAYYQASLDALKQLNAQLVQQHQKQQELLKQQAQLIQVLLDR